MALSVVIPTLNEEQWLPALLASLAESGLPLDVIVVDGNSDDDTRGATERFLEAFPPPSSLRFVEAEARSIALQRNVGAALARHDVILFCDADVVFPEGSLAQFLAIFEKKGYVVAGPRLASLEPGVFFAFLYGVIHVLERFFIFVGRPYLPGGCMLTRKDAFASTGGFDPEVLLGEDVDFSLRVSRFGRCGLIGTGVLVSSRRAIKYGLGWLFDELPNIAHLIMTGRVKDPERIYYPFGDFGDLKR